MFCTLLKEIKMDRDVENLSGDPRIADGYVVLFNYNAHVAVLVRVPTSIKVHAMRRLHDALVFSNFPDQVDAFSIKSKVTGPNGSGVNEITFLVKQTELFEKLSLFLEYARQAWVLKNPIVTDIRNIKMK